MNKMALLIQLANLNAIPHTNHYFLSFKFKQFY